MRRFRPSFRNCFAAARLVLFELATARSTSNASRPPSNSRGRCQRIGNRVEYLRRRGDGAALADALGAGAARPGPCLQIMDFDARDFSRGRHGIVGVAGVEEPRVRSKSNDGTALRITSGSTAWVNASRSVLELRTGDSHGDGDKGPSLVVVKANHASTGMTIPLQWRSNLLVPVLPSTGILGSIERRAAEQVFLDLLDAATRQGRNVSDSKHAGNYAPKTFATSPSAERYSQKELAAAMERLFTAGAIRMEHYGRKSDERSRIVRVVEKASDEPLCGGGGGSARDSPTP
jgi:hypothetical protein